MGVFDNLLARFAPQRALDRARKRHQAAAGGSRSNPGMTPMAYLNPYSGGQQNTRFRTDQAYYRSRPVDEDNAASSFHRETLRLECLDLYRTHPALVSAMRRLADYSIWMGIQPQPSTSDDAWNKVARDFYMQVIWKEVDFRGMPGVDMRQLQRLMVTSRYPFGGCGFIKTNTGQLQPIEIERIVTPNQFRDDDLVRSGHRFNRFGQLAGFYICPRSARGSVDAEQYEFVRKQDFIACWKPWRIDQVAPVPEMHAGVGKMRDYAETDENTLNTVKMESMQISKRFLNKQNTTTNNMPRGQQELTDDNSKKTVVERTEWGLQANLSIGEDMEFMDKKTPNPEHVPYLEHQLISIYAQFGLPVEIAGFLLGKSSFSQLLAADLHANRTFQLVHRDVIDLGLDEHYNWRIAMAIDRGEIPPAPVVDGVSEWWMKEWSLPPEASMQPGKDAVANAQRLNNGETSLSRIIARSGTDRDTIYAERAGDITAAIEMAKKVNDDNPEARVHWRDFINMDVPGVNRSTGEDDTENSDED